jgi:type VI secretion system Hcp family effector
MAQKFSISTEGVKQGKFKGGSSRKGWEGASECLHFHEEVKVPYDTNRGHSTGKRIWETLEIIKEVDPASPLYLTACCTNETIKSAVLKFWRPSKDGKETNHYTITLTNAAVVSVEQWFGNDAAHTEERDTFEKEKIKFSFQQIDIVWTDGGKSFSDAWDTVV